MDIRAYRESDRQGVIGLWREVFAYATGPNDPGKDIDCKMGVQPELFFVAVDGTEVIGAAMAGDDGHRGWVHLVAVHPNYQRRGVGTALMLVVEQSLRQRGCPKINLQVRTDNSAVAAFYQSLGYQIEERISMGKRLGE